MGKILLLSCLILCLINAGAVFAEDPETSQMLHPIVGQMHRGANTVIMWHDTDDDGQADYKATYIFKAGKLHQVSKQFVSPENTRNPTPKKMDVFNG